ncbi:MAG: chlororespiratory reduction protein 7 [Cyanobacteria bacterium REEB459]|nr:chlororespiratory reduction protein 7 [Cyanobacteria bacterium REEB459]
MPDAIMYQGDAYVLLTPGESEEFLSPQELLDRLSALLVDYQSNLPPDLQRQASIADQAKHLCDTACEFTLNSGARLQWYLVRMEKG